MHKTLNKMFMISEVVLIEEIIRTNSLPFNDDSFFITLTANDIERQFFA